MAVYGLQTLKSKVRSSMEIVNKSFTTEEYNRSQFDNYLKRLDELKTHAKDLMAGYLHDRAWYSLYETLEGVALNLLEKAYGNNHT